MVARRQPANPIGWLLLGFGATTAFYGVAGSYAVLDYHFHHGSLPLGPAAVLVASELWILVFLMLPLVVLLFPDGRLPSRWRLVLWVYVGICALLVAVLLGFGSWDMAGTRIVVTGKGQLVSNLARPGRGHCVCRPGGRRACVLGPVRGASGAQLAAGQRRAPCRSVSASGS